MRGILRDVLFPLVGKGSIILRFRISSTHASFRSDLRRQVHPDGLQEAGTAVALKSRYETFDSYKRTAVFAKEQELARPFMRLFTNFRLLSQGYLFSLARDLVCVREISDFSIST